MILPFPPQAISASLLVADTDSNNCTSASVQIAIGYQNDANGTDLLSFTNQLGITGSWNAATGTLTLTGISGVGNYRTALRAVMFSTSGSNVSPVNRTLTIVKYLGGSLTRRTAKFELSWMPKLHREMFGDVSKCAGQTRTGDLNLGSPWHQVSIQLQNLCDDLAYWRKHWPDVVEQATHLHHRAVLIHPFLNGNGRWSRLLANIWLKLNKQPVTAWPEEAIGAT